MDPIEEHLRQLLAADIDPYLGTDLISAGALTTVDVSSRPIRITLDLGFPITRYRAELEARLQAVLAPAGMPIELDIKSRILAREVQKGTKPLPEIRNIIAVASGDRKSVV